MPAGVKGWSGVRAGRFFSLNFCSKFSKLYKFDKFFKKNIPRGVFLVCPIRVRSAAATQYAAVLPARRERAEHAVRPALTQRRSQPDPAYPVSVPSSRSGGRAETNPPIYAARKKRRCMCTCLLNVQIFDSAHGERASGAPGGLAWAGR